MASLQRFTALHTWLHSVGSFIINFNYPNYTLNWLHIFGIILVSHKTHKLPSLCGRPFFSQAPSLLSTLPMLDKERRLQTLKIRSILLGVHNT